MWKSHPAVERGWGTGLGTALAPSPSGGSGRAVPARLTLPCVFSSASSELSPEEEADRVAWVGRQRSFNTEPGLRSLNKAKIKTICGTMSCGFPRP